MADQTARQPQGISSTGPQEPMSSDHVLTTTRSVRRRLDLRRPVPRKMIEECVGVAVQAPSGGSREDWRFIAVDEPTIRAQLAEVYRDAFVEQYGTEADPSPAALCMNSNVMTSARYLAANLEKVPVLVLPCRDLPAPTRREDQAGFWASIHPAAWSFMLAARSRGLASTYTSRALAREEGVAAILRIPYPYVTIAGIMAVAFPDSSNFRPAKRRPAAEVLSWNVW